MMTHEKPVGKILPILLVILILVIVAAGAGFYLSWMSFDQKYQDLSSTYDEFESRYESLLSTLRSDQMEMKAFIEESRGKTQEETNKLRIVGILLKAKGEIITGKLSLSRDQAGKSLEHLDTAIDVLKEAFELADGGNKAKIENIRLQLATIKGLVEADPDRAQQEMDMIWREIDDILGE